MFIPGRLSRTTLGDVLAGLGRLEATGYLRLEELPPSGLVHRLEFYDGRLTQVSSPFGVALGTLLSGGEQDWLVPEGRLSLGEEWVHSGRASADAVRDALREQRAARLEYLFGLKEARLSFHPQREAPVGGVAVEPLAFPELVSGRRRFMVRDAGQPADTRRSMILETLGLGPNATRDDVRAAFRQLARSLHPDSSRSLGTEERAQLNQRFARVSSVYHELIA